MKIILVHGIWDKPNVFNTLVKRLEEKGFSKNLLIEITPNDASISIMDMALQLGKFIDENVGKDEKFNIIGFSMGGIVARYYLQFLNPNSNVNNFITISSPHKGTLTALIGNHDGYKDMRHGSQIITKLNENNKFIERTKFTSIYTPLDLMIVPFSSSKVEGAKNIAITVPAHHLMVKSKRVIDTIINILEENLPSMHGGD